MKKLLLAALLLASSLASAQNTKAKPAPTPAPSVANAGSTDDCARARKAGKTCVLDIGEENIEGSGVTPSGIGVNVRQFAVLNRLIHSRKDFIPQIVKAAEDID